MDDPALYQIRVAERLDDHWARWFAPFEIVHCGGTMETVLRGRVADQSALFGVLTKVRDLGLTLISVQRER